MRTSQRMPLFRRRRPSREGRLFSIDVWRGSEERRTRSLSSRISKTTRRLRSLRGVTGMWAPTSKRLSSASRPRACNPRRIQLERSPGRETKCLRRTSLAANLLRDGSIETSAERDGIKWNFQTDATNAPGHRISWAFRSFIAKRSCGSPKFAKKSSCSATSEFNAWGSSKTASA